jgi:hypothetical protein
MTNDEREQNAAYLESMLFSPGGNILFKHIDEMIVEGWEKFIALPVLEKTSKAAFNYQAQYEVLKKLREWVNDEIRLAKDLRQP